LKSSKTSRNGSTLMNIFKSLIKNFLRYERLRIELEFHKDEIGLLKEDYQDLNDRVKALEEHMRKVNHA
jgi:DNA anti-recombination protein RmuC